MPSGCPRGRGDDRLGPGLQEVYRVGEWRSAFRTQLPTIFGLQARTTPRKSHTTLEQIYDRCVRREQHCPDVAFWCDDVMAGSVRG
jgi:hypothetical protein